MKVSMQVNVFNGWSNNAPAIHKVKDWDEAVTIAFALSHQFGNTTVRICELPASWDGSAEWIDRLSGTYIQSHEPNKEYTHEWICRIFSSVFNPLT